MPADSVSPPEPPNPNGPFARPLGSSRNTLVGSIDPLATSGKLVVINLIPNCGLKNGEIVVTRTPQLQPTSVLKIVQISNRTALAAILRGQPQINQEVVLPSSDLTKKAQELPERPPGS